MVPFAGVARYLQGCSLNLESRAFVNGFLADAHRGACQLYPRGTGLDVRRLFRNDQAQLELAFVAQFTSDGRELNASTMNLCFDGRPFDLCDLLKMLEVFHSFESERGTKDVAKLTAGFEALMAGPMKDPESTAWCVFLVGEYPIYGGGEVAIFSDFLDPVLGINLLRRGMYMKYLQRSK